ncbi:hypothetical protein OYT40_002181 [Escherichia coli]|nr:hypothetical protein [Escherichia coli]
MHTELLNQKHKYNHVTKKVTVSYKPRKRHHEHHPLVIGGSIRVSLRVGCGVMARVEQTPQMTTLTINRKCDIDNIFFSQETKSWGYYIMLNGQFFRESGYLTANIAKRYYTKQLKLLLQEHRE